MVCRDVDNQDDAIDVMKAVALYEQSADGLLDASQVRMKRWLRQVMRRLLLPRRMWMRRMPVSIC